MWLFCLLGKSNSWLRPWAAGPIMCFATKEFVCDLNEDDDNSKNSVLYSFHSPFAVSSNDLEWSFCVKICFQGVMCGDSVLWLSDITVQVSK